MNVPVGCGYFFDANIGLVGSGNFSGTGTIPNYQLRIWRTINGGNTWTQCSTPNGTGRVTSIYMRDANVGYASIFSSLYSLWKTTDGGVTWRDHTQGETGTSVCVHATSNRLIKTMWDRNGTTGGAGGVSSNDGSTFNDVFQSQFNEDSYNGIAFMDDMNGIVVPGPGARNPDCLITNNGGQTWLRGGRLDESWGIYAAKGQNIYLTLAEGDATNAQTLVRVTTNGGATWQTRHTFPSGWGDPGFSGHIAGKGTTVYVQTTSDGLYRSDNLGLNWKSVGGPDYQRDTRFVVTGCQGEVVFAFDNAGGIWRTKDGGDGSMSGSASPELFIGELSSVFAGDTAHIPIHLKPSLDTYSFNSYSIHLSYNTDLLSCEDFDIVGTLSNPIISKQIINDATGVEFICEMRNPVTEKSDVTLPLVRLVTRTYVTTTLETIISIDAVSKSLQPPLPLCTIPSRPFKAIEYQCGDSMLVQLMRDGSIPEISFIKPNPVIGGAMIVGVKMSNEIPVSFEIVDMQGNVVAKLPEQVLSEGSHEVHFDTSTLLSGSYMVSLRAGNTMLASSKVSIQK